VRRAESEHMWSRGSRTAPGPADTPETGWESLLTGTEAHHSTAARAAAGLLAKFGPDGSGPPRAETAPLVQSIIAAEDASRRMIGEAVHRCERESGLHLDRLRTLECSVCGFVMVVLLLEGLFVISPAVRRIQLFMSDMNRSHEEMKTYAARLERSNKE